MAPNGEVTSAMVKPRIASTPTALRQVLWLWLVLVVAGSATLRAQLPESSLSSYILRRAGLVART